MPASADAEVLGEPGRAGLPGRVPDHQQVQGVVLEVLQPEVGERLVGGELPVPDEPLAADHDRLDVVLEARRRSSGPASAPRAGPPSRPCVHGSDSSELLVDE